MSESIILLYYFIDKSTGKIISAPEVDQNFESEIISEESVLKTWEIKWHRLW